MISAWCVFIPTTVLNGQVLFAIFAIGIMFPYRFHKAREYSARNRCPNFLYQPSLWICPCMHRCQPLRFFRNCYEFRAKITVLRSTVYLLRISDYCRPEIVPHLNIIEIVVPIFFSSLQKLHFFPQTSRNWQKRAVFITYSGSNKKWIDRFLL
jgi:hypothetical protein